ncbi:Transcription factor GTE1 [Hibiscus syriacus]|uniref:Transcription factor GTE1 n=1 Tax=Hibiscus syriacus TaxID=106335 RepID=A0A6A2WC26_HIBSY|nr:transcription factor GTE1-like isoform X1 [Hibiscus syriacus]XP_039053751.1 transcription factor GTE1-like isoform X1 [Hibiscus syriacus]XP_039053752.1 transcription factor GTE1-like isoform X1 [Hibiscus syriacus]KAE8655622.1 Transcription factor GTE1 [Hibiscus syriacus]
MEAVKVEDFGPESEVEDLGRYVDKISTIVNGLEKRVNDVEHLYLTTDNMELTVTKCNSACKEKVKEKQLTGIEKRRQEASHREAASMKRMQELMRQFTTILRQITQHKWAHPFMHPVDVEGLGLHDYYEVVQKPMDFGTIKSKMEAKDCTGYKNVREIYSDVRLVFKNAMKYNDERHDVHIMAKTLLEKFEEKWLQLLPKVAEEEKRLVEEEAKAELDVKLAQEIVHSNMAKELSNELCAVDLQLEKLRQIVIQKCRKMPTEEKKKLGMALTRLSPEDLSKALEIVAENNPGFQPTAQEVDLDIDAQSELTLWRLKFFVQDKLKHAGKCSEVVDCNNINNNENTVKSNSKRRREMSDALTKNAIKRNRKLSPNS